MIICVPSYKRAEICITDKYIIGAKIIVPESQAEEYRKYHENVISIPDELDWNISKKRNAILDLFPNEDIVMLDDDIIEFTKLENWKLTKLPWVDAIAVFESIIADFENNNCELAGVYPINNAFYMSETKKAGFIIGSCMIFKRWFKERFNTSIMAKEDYEMTIMKFMWGGVIRYNMYSHKKKEYIGMGGVAGQRTEKNIDKIATCYLLNKYPRYVRLNKKREDQILLKL